MKTDNKTDAAADTADEDSHLALKEAHQKAVAAAAAVDAAAAAYVKAAADAAYAYAVYVKSRAELAAYLAQQLAALE